MYYRKARILILGAGLASLRTALSATAHTSSRHHEEAQVLVVSPNNTPSGSSFANANGFLGMQAPALAGGRSHLAQRIAAIGAPGTIVPELVQLLVTEAHDRYLELCDLGLSFRMDHTANTHWRGPGCFVPDIPSCVVLDNLPHAFDTLRTRINEQGGELLTGWVVRSLLQERSGAPVLGAVLENQQGEHLCVQADTIFLGTGGTGSLYRHSLAPSTSQCAGTGLFLLHQAGAALCNAGWTQFLWLDSQRNFVPVHNELVQPVSEELRQIRSTHCPYAHGQKQSEIDHEFARSAPATIRLHGQAHNGGARIDQHGQTTVPGLYAGGECASGMHGANRAGGGMVAATQVFGHRAGIHMAQNSAHGKPTSQQTLQDMARSHMHTQQQTDPQTETLCSRILQAHTLPAPLPHAHPLFQAHLREAHDQLSALHVRTCGWLTRQRISSALIMISHLRRA